MSLGNDAHTLVRLHQFKESDHSRRLASYRIPTDKLRSDWTAVKNRILFGAHQNVLSNLCLAEAIASALGLNGNNELCTSTIDANIKLVGLDLTDSLHRGPKVALQ